MVEDQQVIVSLSGLEHDLIEEIRNSSKVDVFPEKATLVREGQFLKHLPVVIEGVVKVYKQFDDKDLLLYYIMPNQSCIISFSSLIYNEPSQIYAITEKESKVLLLPATKIPDWSVRFPRFNKLFIDLYHQRYLELLETINQFVFLTLDQRIVTYLKEKSRIMQTDVIRIRHHEIARDLGTAREVVTRVIKRLESEQKIAQTPEGIKILQ